MKTVGDLVKQFNWRFMLIRILVNAAALLLVVLFVPSIYFVDKTVLNLFFLAIALGILNTLIKPIIQFLTLPYIFATYGLILALINALLLFLLALLFPTRFAVESLLWLIVAGILIGIVSSMLESLFGLTMPIMPEEPEELRQYVEEQRPSIVKQLLDAEAETEAHGEAESKRPPALVDSESEGGDIPSPAEASPKEPVELGTSQFAVRSEKDTPIDAESALSPESMDEVENKPATNKKGDATPRTDSTNQIGTQEGDR